MNIKIIGKYACEVLEDNFRDEENIINVPYSTAEELSNVLGISKKFENGVLADMTAEETMTRRKDRLRGQRKRDCFSVVNRGQAWYDTLTAEQKSELAVWYRAWLDVTATMVEPAKPSWLN